MVATNFTGGVTNVAEQAAMGNFVFPDPSRCHTWFSDFDKFYVGSATTPAVNGDWLLTQITGSTATATVGNADGGVVALTNDSSASHGVAVQLKGMQASVIETFSWESGRSMWFKTRMKISTATNSSFVMGLQITDTTPFAVSDGIYFAKADASTAVSFNAIKTAAGTTTVSNIATMADDTYIDLAFYYAPAGDGIGSALPVCIVYANDVRVAQITDFTNFPTRTLTLSFAMQNGAAGASTILSCDYLLCSKTRAVTWTNA